MLFFYLCEWYCDNHPPLRGQLKIILDLTFRVTKGNGTKDAFEYVFVLPDKAFPHVGGKIAVRSVL